MAKPPITLREARVAAGLSQAAVAAAAGISRQAVGSIEAGHHRPSVDAALAIARVVDRSVEALFGTTPALARPILGPPLPNGSAILGSRVGERVVYAAASAALAFTGWPEANAVLHDGHAHLLPGADLQGLVVVGCDPALGTSAALLPSAGSRRLIAISGSTGTALEAMRDGRAHAALVHNRPESLPAVPPGVLRLHLARWRVGVAGRGTRAPSIARLCKPGTQVVQREAGASSQKAFLTAAAANGTATVDGPIASGHVDAARRVADGALAGVTMEPAALQFGLGFQPLEEHVVEIWIDARWHAHPGVEALANLLTSATFTSRMSLIGGYELADAGAQRRART